MDMESGAWMGFLRMCSRSSSTEMIGIPNFFPSSTPQVTSSTCSSVEERTSFLALLARTNLPKQTLASNIFRGTLKHNPERAQARK